MASTFHSAWTAHVLGSSPLILPSRSYVWPVNVPGEEDALARGALSVMVKPQGGSEFLLTCALGFESPTLPRGVWNCPNPDDICCVAGGYAYIANVMAPERPALLEQRPVVDVRACVEQRLLLFVGFHDVLAWSENGIAWRSPRLTDEGLTLGEVHGDVLHGTGWEMRTDKDVAFALDLHSGKALR